jgi:hypothetical protein
MKERIVEIFAPRAIVALMIYVLFWSILDFTQGGL